MRACAWSSTDFRFSHVCWRPHLLCFSLLALAGWLRQALPPAGHLYRTRPTLLGLGQVLARAADLRAHSYRQMTNIFNLNVTVAVHFLDFCSTKKLGIAFTSNPHCLNILKDVWFLGCRSNF